MRKDEKKREFFGKNEFRFQNLFFCSDTDTKIGPWFRLYTILELIADISHYEIQKPDFASVSQQQIHRGNFLVLGHVTSLNNLQAF